MSNNQVEYGIRINVSGNRASSDAIDQVAVSTDKLTTASEKAGQSLTVVNGQMNDTAVMMRKSAEATSLASEAAQKFLAPLQREIDLFGASRAEVERYKASKAGLSSVVQQQAAALGASIDAMHRDEQAARLLAAEEDRAAKAAEQFLNKLKEQVAVLGMNTAQLQAHRAAQLGVSDAAAPLIAKLSEAGAGAHSAGKHMEGLNFQTVGARRELLVLMHELSQGNIKNFGGSMMVLGEQTGAAGLLFSAAGLAAIGLTAAVVGVGYAVIKGAAEQRAMNNALIETGTYAGVTGDSLNAMAHAAVETGGSIREAKKAVTELAATGRFTGDQIGYIADAAIAMEHATGKSIEKTIKEFESLAVQTSGNSLRATEAISRAALKLDDQYHFLTESVYEQIRALEKEGDQKGASALATETLAKVTKERAEEMVSNLGYVARGWHAVTEAIGGAVDKIGEWGSKSPGRIVDRYVAELQAFDKAVRGDHTRNGIDPDKLTAGEERARAAIVNDLTKAVIEKNKADAAAIAQGETQRAQSEAAHAASRIEQDDVRLGKKGMSELDDAIQKYGEDLAKLAAANPGSKLLDQDEVNKHMALILKAHTAAAKGNDDRAKLLQDALTIEQTGLDRERSIYEARDKMLSLYHSKFGLSDDDFYAGRAAARAEYIASEAITYAQETALVQGAIARTPQEVAARKAKYDELVKAHQKFVDDMRNAGGEDVLSQMAASDAIVRQSDDTINKYISSLDQEAQKLEDANKGHELSRASVERETVARLDLAIAYEKQWLLEQSLVAATADELAQGQAVLKFLEDQRTARLRIAQALDQADADKAAKHAAQKAAQEWDTTAKHIQTTLADAIMNGGANAWKKLKTAIAQQVLQVPLQYIGNTGASFMVPNAPQASSALGGSTGSGAIGAAQTASSLYKMVSGGLLDGAGTAIASAGTLFGSSALSAFGAGFAGNAAGTTMTAAEMFQGMGMTTEASAASAGSAAASYAEVGAGLIAGHYIGGAISNGYGSQSTTNVSQAIGTAIGAYLGGAGGAAIGAAIGGAVGGLLNRAFGMGEKKTTQGVEGNITSTGTTGNAFENWTQEGGWFRSDKSGGSTSALPTDLANSFTAGLAALKAASAGFAKSLGVDADSIADYQKTFRFNFSATDTAANQKIITDFFISVGDDLATRLVPSLSQFQRTGETAAATLQRLSGEFQVTDQIAQLMGKTSAEVFGKLGIESAAARERLIDLAGGASTLAQQAAGYAQNFLSEAERLAPVSKAVAAAMAELGLADITSREQFKAHVDQLVSSGAVLTEAGAKEFASMMQLEDAFAQVHPAIEATTAAVRSQADVLAERADLQQQLDELTLSSTALLKKQRDALDETNRGLFDQVQAAHQVDAARTALTEAYQREADVIKATQDRMSSFASSLRALHDNALLGDLSPLTPQQKYAEAKAQYERTLAGARNGDATAQANYDQAYNAFLTASRTVNASGGQYQADFAYAQRATEEAATWAEQQVDVAKASLDALEAQVSGLVDVKDAVLSVHEAIAALADAMGADGAEVVGGAQARAIEALYQSLLGRDADQGGLQFWQRQMAQGASVGDVGSLISQSDEYGVEGLYKSMLGRLADKAGMDYWLETMHNGATLTDVRDAISKSDEYSLYNPGGAATEPAAYGIDYSAMGTAPALMSLVKDLREDNKALTAQVVGLRADLSQQTGDQINATFRASDESANKIADATALAVQSAAAKETRVIPV
jgi:phage-related minor tail protein